MAISQAKIIVLGAMITVGGICESFAAETSAPSRKVIDWTGLFVGSQLAQAVGEARYSLAGVGVPPSPVSLNLTNPFDPFKGTGSYAVGLSAGYNTMLSERLVVGGEADCFQIWSQDRLWRRH